MKQLFRGGRVPQEWFALFGYLVVVGGFGLFGGGGVYPIGQQRSFWIPLMMVFEQYHKLLFGFWASAPTTHTTVPHSPAKVFLDSSDDGF